MDLEDKILEFFKSKGSIPGNSKAEYLNCKYLEVGLVDSMQLVEMIVLFEDEFKIKFTTEDLQSNEFRTISGLINIINKLNTDKKIDYV